jgi:acyl-CoA thioesterase-1
MVEPTTNDAVGEAEAWLRYTHLEKLYGYLPGVPAALPALFGIDDDTYVAVRRRFEDRVRTAAAELLDRSDIAAAVDRLPFQVGSTVLAVGDSFTDDWQSWVEILRQLLEQRRPDLGVRLVNGGLSAHTTAMVLRRWPGAVAAVRPDWIICQLGANDVTRVGPPPAKCQVSLDESVANLRELQRIAAASSTARWVWLTPLPVLEERVADHPPFQHGPSRWRNEDLTALADAVRTLPGTVVELGVAFGNPPDPRLLGPDGVHPTLSGQVEVTARLVDQLARVSIRP